MLSRVKGLLNKNEFTRHVLVLMSGTAIGQAIGIVSLFILPRLYSQADIGVYSLYNALVLSLIPLVALRYDYAIVLPESREDAIALANTCLRIACYVCAGITVIAIFFARPIAVMLGSSDLAIWLYFVGANLLIIGVTQVYTMWLTRIKEFGGVSRNRINQSLTMATLQIGLPFLSVGGVTGLVAGTIAGQCISAIGISRTSRKTMGGASYTKEDRKRLIAEHRRMPILNGPNILIDFMRTNGINFLVLRFFGDVLLGQFAWALRITQAPLGLINGAISQVFFQKLAVTRPGQMLALVRSSAIRSALLGVVPFGLLYFLAPWFFALVMPLEWARTGVYVQALTPWLFLNLITSPISNLFMVLGRQLSMLIFSVFYAVVPLATIVFKHDSLLETVWWISLEMTVLLIGFIVLALVESRRFDRHGDVEPTK